ncbi:hypothetical protein KOW79_002006 [Hemibagrus wyckioides]|uniref:Ig-like domain-containing protein n=1 Tax=Hemibagrus wyckioides TaxID=337641 RepID=A0A9D3P619_9TELE|nr:hypothetical protein KOW79_002006 [Hemibagrus wyckioides]
MVSVKLWRTEKTPVQTPHTMFSTSLLLLLAAASYVHGEELTQPASMTVQPGQSLSIHCKVDGQAGPGLRRRDARATSAGYCAYRWLKRSSDLQAAELQAAHGSVVDDVEEAETTENREDSSTNNTHHVLYISTAPAGSCFLCTCNLHSIFLQSDTDRV